jgi:hypothetical protein
MDRLATIVRFPVELIRAWRASDALDKTSTKRTTPGASVAREQAVMHALLRSRDQVPVHQPDAVLRRKIAAALENTTPVSVRRTSALDTLRVGAAPALVAVALAVGVHVAGSNLTGTPKGSPAVHASGNPAGAPSDTRVAAGTADPLNPGPASEFGNRPVTQADLMTPVSFPIGAFPTRQTDDASISSMPLMREANALQQAVPLVRDAIIHRLPPMPERPK